MKKNEYNVLCFEKSHTLWHKGKEVKHNGTDYCKGWRKFGERTQKI